MAQDFKKMVKCISLLLMTTTVIPLLVAANAEQQVVSKQDFTSRNAVEDDDCPSWVQNGENYEGEQNLGYAGLVTAISGDGNTVAYGSAYAGDGYVNVVKYVDGEYSSQEKFEPPPGGSGDSRYGSGVALSEDGTVMAVGRTRTSEVFIYRNFSPNNDEKVSSLGYNDNFGAAVALSSDGKILAVGAPLNDDGGYNSGTVHIYEVNSVGGWDLIQSINGEDDDDYYGTEVALSSSGDTVAIGSTFNSGDYLMSGRVRVFTHDGTSYEKVGDDIDGGKDVDMLGESIALARNGQVLAIGAPGSNAVHIYDFTSGWNLIDTLTGTEDDRVGYSVSMNADGTVIAVGFEHNNDAGSRAGSVQVYMLGEGSYQELGESIKGESVNGKLGRAVSLSDNGKAIAIGGNGLYEAGRVRYFELELCDTNAPSMSPTPVCNENEFELRIEFQADNNSKKENVLRVMDLQISSTVLWIPNKNPGMQLRNGKLFETSLCLWKYDCYLFHVIDKGRDGICCEDGKGYYKLYVDGMLINHSIFYHGEKDKYMFSNPHDSASQCDSYVYLAS